ncbi:MAG: hypothetical protein SFX74_02640 [Fimbriimonadaceae bacterium]|nr:hypothetical protein [Fimbriimonadaceae bacterium]
MQTTDPRAELNLSRLAPGFGVVGLVGVLAYWGMMFAGNHDAFGSFMFGWFFWLSLTIGLFTLTILNHATRAQWTLAVLRLLESGGSAINFAAMLVMFAPILIMPKHLYEWVDKALVDADPFLKRKEFFLNQPGWTVRVLFVFVFCVAVAAWYRNSVRKQEQTGEFKLEQRRLQASGVILFVFALLATMFLTDLVMSMEPHWSSTMYGPWQLVAGMGVALAFCLVIQCTNAGKAPFKEVVHKELLRDQGLMLFAFTMLWGYTSISQFLIIWNGNLPETTSYFVKRSSAMHPPGMEANHWGALGLLLILGRFFIPFFVLLAPRTRTKAMNLARIAGWIFVMHIFDMYMLVIPAVHGRAALGPLSPNLFLDLGAWISVGCLWMALFAWQTRQASLLPRIDTRLQEAKAHAH